LPSTFSSKLKGKYTTPEIYNAIVQPNMTVLQAMRMFDADKGYTTSSDNNWAIQTLSFFNGFTKAGLTIWSNGSQARNFTGAMMNLVAAGHLPKGMIKAFSDSTATFGRGQKIGTNMSAPMGILQVLAKGFDKRSEEEIQNEFMELAKYGLTEQSLDIGVLNELAAGMSRLNKANLKSRYSKFQSYFAEPYQAADLMFKKIMFDGEFKRLNEIYGRTYKEKYGEAEAERLIKEKAAYYTKRHLPTYGDAPQIFKSMSRNSVLASFILFSAEMMRTRFNIIWDGIATVRKDDLALNTEESKKLKAYGVRKLGGMMASSLFFKGVAMGINSAFGWDDDDEEAYRQTLPSFSENNTLIFFGSDKKNPLVFDVSFSDPFTQPFKILEAFGRGDNYSESFNNALGELIDPYTGGEIFFTEMVRIYVAEKDRYGNDLFREEEGGQDMKKFLALSESIIPKTFKELTALGKGANLIDTSDEHGRSYDWKTELLSMMAGFKPKTVDVAQNVYYQNRNLDKRVDNKLKEMRVYNEGSGAREEVQESLDAWHKKQVKLHQSMVQLGFSDEKISETFYKDKVYDDKTGEEKTNSSGEPIYKVNSQKRKRFKKYIKTGDKYEFDDKGKLILPKKGKSYNPFKDSGSFDGGTMGDGGSFDKASFN
jgi:hypothetical protein